MKATDYTILCACFDTYIGRVLRNKMSEDRNL